MTRETRRNFAIGGAFLAGLLLLQIYIISRPKRCETDAHVVLVLVDHTDRIGSDAMSALKDRVWQIIEKAPEFSRVIVRPILGKDDQGNLLTREAREGCRPEMPSASSGLRGAVAIRKKWRAFEATICGQGLRGVPRCGDRSRQKSFFDTEQPPSQSSPILEQAVDDARTFLARAGGTDSWDLVIATDWKQYTDDLNLHTIACNGPPKSMLDQVPILVGAGPAFRAIPPNQTRSGRESTITSFFVLRDGMSDAEADCLEDVARHFLATNASNINARGIRFERLPRTSRVQ